MESGSFPLPSAPLTPLSSSLPLGLSTSLPRHHLLPQHSPLSSTPLLLYLHITFPFPSFSSLNPDSHFPQSPFLLCPETCRERKRERIPDRIDGQLHALSFLAPSPSQSQTPPKAGGRGWVKAVALRIPLPGPLWGRPGCAFVHFSRREWAPGVPGSHLHPHECHGKS